MENDEGTNTDFGVFPTGSTISQQLNPVEFDTKFFDSMEKSNKWDFLFRNSQNYHSNQSSNMNLLYLPNVVYLCQKWNTLMKSGQRLKIQISWRKIHLTKCSE